MSKATATACANIALVKYWGKRDAALNLPARGSLSATIDALKTHTTVEVIDAPEDELYLDGEKKSGRAVARITRHVDLVRAATGRRERVRVTSTNSFPTAAGLASSASGFAALAVGASRALGHHATPSELSVLARRGSGSAARSIFGGFVRMYAGTRDDGTDAFARPMDGVHVELAAAIAVARAKEKEIGSTDGMDHTAATSPYHDEWLTQVDRDLDACEAALRAKDFDALAAVTEGSCLAMHADAMASRPGIIYFQPVTLWAIARVRALRAEGVPVFFTIDAGPHVVAFTEPAHLERVRAALSAHAEIDQVLTSHLGGPAHVVEAL
ncbi:diphosphomevalonate decarboxylase [Myxococcota bacterium]|nr:diphosphomevalonate decarboxylase [Myxococcota bacterium]